jgi:hypothetical protein
LKQRFSRATQPSSDSFGASLHRIEHVHCEGKGYESAAAVGSCLFELACAVNALRNVEGTRHGRAFPANLRSEEAPAAIEGMRIIAERMLASL